MGYFYLPDNNQYGLPEGDYFELTPERYIHLIGKGCFMEWMVAMAGSFGAFVQEGGPNEFLDGDELKAFIRILGETRSKSTTSNGRHPYDHDPSIQ